MIKGVFISVGMLLCLAAAGVEAGWFGADFSADTVISAPQRQQQLGRMYVSAGRVRTEMENAGESLVEIIDPAEGLAWLLNPRQQAYRQRPVPKMQVDSGHDHEPCAQLSGAHCERLGEEPLNGRGAVKWAVQAEGRLRLQWHDAEHGFAVRIVEAEHELMSMRYLGTAQLGGREVERWLSTMQGPQGAVQSEQWYDPQLNIAIRQQAPDGAVRELRNIQVGKQPDALFRVPDGYRLQEAAQ